MTEEKTAADYVREVIEELGPDFDHETAVGLVVARVLAAGIVGEWGLLKRAALELLSEGIAATSAR